jgi:glycosyltransferase involved in cell wall biosynthesis
MKICLFGNYNSSYSRNAIILKGLRSQNVRVLDCHVEAETLEINTSKDLGLKLYYRKIANKLNLVLKVVRNFSKFYDSDLILLMYPGHLELPLAYLCKLIFNKPLAFDIYFSLSEHFLEERALFNKKSLVYKLLFNFEKQVYKLADIIIVGSKADGDYLSKKFAIPKKKLLLLYIGADNSIYKRSLQKPGFYKKVEQRKNNEWPLAKKFIVSYYGKYNPYHSVETIIKAAAILRENKNIRFRMIGVGQDLRKASRLAKSLRLDNVLFDRLVEKDRQTIERLNKSEIFLGVFGNNAISQRAIPNKVFQGIALEKAVVTADTEGIHEKFSHKKDIFLCKPDNPKSLALAISTLEANKELRRKIAENGYKLYLQSFAPARIGEEFVKQIKNKKIMK